MIRFLGQQHQYSPPDGVVQANTNAAVIFRVSNLKMTWRTLPRAGTAGPSQTRLLSPKIQVRPRAPSSGRGGTWGAPAVAHGRGAPRAGEARRPRPPAAPSVRTRRASARRPPPATLALTWGAAARATFFASVAAADRSAMVDTILFALSMRLLGVRARWGAACALPEIPLFVFPREK
jgi:hypothetical protein